jgi:SNF family Na+-dependent transporter
LITVSQKCRNDFCLTLFLITTALERKRLMADFSLTWEVVTGFFASVGVIYTFALKNTRYYLDIISGKAFKVLLNASLLVYFIQLFINIYSDKLSEKLNDYPAAKVMVIEQWQSFFTVVLYIGLALTFYWIAYIVLEALIRSFEAHRKQNGE